MNKLLTFKHGTKVRKKLVKRNYEFNIKLVLKYNQSVKFSCFNLLISDALHMLEILKYTKISSTEVWVQISIK